MNFKRMILIGIYWLIAGVIISQLNAHYEIQSIKGDLMQSLGAVLISVGLCAKMEN